MPSQSCSFVDFHCHLDLYDDPEQAVARAAAAGIYTLTVTTTPSAWTGTSNLVGKAPRIRVGLGLHPEIAHERLNELELFRALIPSAQYIGEVGLDGLPQYRKYQGAQLSAFKTILEIAQRHGGRVLSIHSRRAVPQVLELLADHPAAGIPVLHWFAGTKRQLQQACDLGCWFSVGPGMLNSDAGRERLRNMPINRLLTETDGPFVPNRGHPAGPWDMPEIVSGIANIRQVEAKELASTISDNLRNLISSIQAPISA